MSIVNRLVEKKLVNPPSWLSNNTLYECTMGSVAYGVSSNSSDVDLYGFCIPPKHIIFPHLAGYISGFGKQPVMFEQYSQHHVLDNEKEYDIVIYNIVKFFNLAMQNNPNMVDALFVPRRCIHHITESAQIVRDNRRLFLHKGSYHKFRGYAYAQLSKIKNGSNRSNPERQKNIDEYGYDTKFAYHIVRLLLQVQQILVEHDLDLERNSEILKSVRRGEWSFNKLEEWFQTNEKVTDEINARSTLREYPDEEAIKKLLLSVLEQHYGNLSEAVHVDKSVEMLINDMREVMKRYE